MRLLAILVAVVVSVPCAGCCNLARFLCGPDTSEWVSERFDTPELTVMTFREAVRRADARAIHRCMSEGLKQRWGLPGEIEAEIAWKRIQEEVSGIHVLGYAEVSPIETVAPGYATAVLSVAGRSLRVALVRQPFWEVRWVYGDDPGDLEKTGRYLESVRSLVDAAYDEDEFQTTLTVRMPPVDAELDLERVQTAAIGFRWKVDRIEEVAPEISRWEDG